MPAKLFYIVYFLFQDGFRTKPFIMRNVFSINNFKVLKNKKDYITIG